MDTTPAPPSWHQAWSWWGIYAAMSLADYGLTTYALAAGRMGFTPSGPYEVNPLTAWL